MIRVMMISGLKILTKERKKIKDLGVLWDMLHL
jgi:hypothetical protein